MAEDSLQLDSTEKPKPQAPLWMLIVALLGFACFTASLVLQILERNYMRGKATSETDTFAAQTLIPLSE